MTRRQKRQVYVGLVAICAALFVAGLVFGYQGRHTPICKDGKPPRQQQDTGLGQVVFLCHDGQMVTK
jgi:hypothetical protein